MIMQQFLKKGRHFSNLSFSEKEFLMPKILGDSYCVTILKTIKEMPKSCIEICAETKIPISTVYRRVQTLYDLDLLRVTGSISNDGKKYFLYKSKIKSIEIKFDGKLEVKIKFV
jgi:predicted transcriptional regulator